MKNILNNKRNFLAVILVLLLVAFNIASCVNSCGQDSARRSEMVKRINLEESLIKVTQEKNSLAEKLSAREKELEKEKAEFEAAKKNFNQEKLICQNLKGELDNLNKVNAALEEDLKKSLAALKKAKR